MKCSESQIASKRASALSDGHDARPSDARLRQLASEFEAQLLTVALRPMTKNLGPMSEVVSQQIAMSVATQISSPLYDQLRHEMG